MSSGICIISETLQFPFDEGVKNFVYNLIRELHKKTDILALSIRGGETDKRYIRRLSTNKTFLDYSLFREVRHFDPVAILYIPSASATLASFLRTRVLKSYARTARVIMIALQSQEYSFLSRKLIPVLVPDLVLVQSPSLLKQLCRLDCRVDLIPSGVDLQRFHPVVKQRKLELMNKHGIEVDRFTILHVGHINRKRNIHILKELQRDSSQVIVVGSTSTEQDKDLADQLRIAGVKVITSYVENIEEIYQLSDCYIFPVTSNTASIEVPLSVLEAMACNLPVATTRYGGLSPMFNDEHNGLFFVDESNDLSDKVKEARKLNHCETRIIVEPYAWENVAKNILLKVF